MRIAPSRLVAVGLAALVISCGGAAGKPVEVEPAPPAKPRNAAALAQAIASGKVSALLYAERAQGHPLAARVAALELWKPVLAGTGLDPERDLVRAFVTMPRASAGRDAVAVLEHRVPPERLDSALAMLMLRSEPQGAPIEGLGVPAVRITVRRQPWVVARVDPDFLIVLPEGKAREAARFVGTGGFPDPVGAEAAVIMALDPSETLRAPRVPAVPPTVSALQVMVTLAANGGADLALDGPSASPEQAAADAAELSEAVESATTIRVAILKIRVIDPVEFFAEGDRVKVRRHVSPGELDKLFGLLSAFVPR